MTQVGVDHGRAAVQIWPNEAGATPATLQRRISLPSERRCVQKVAAVGIGIGGQIGDSAPRSEAATHLRGGMEVPLRGREGPSTFW